MRIVNKFEKELERGLQEDLSDAKLLASAYIWRMIAEIDDALYGTYLSFENFESFKKWMTNRITAEIYTHSKATYDRSKRIGKNISDKFAKDLYDCYIHGRSILSLFSDSYPYEKINQLIR